MQTGVALDNAFSLLMSSHMEPISRCEVALLLVTLECATLVQIVLMLSQVCVGSEMICTLAVCPFGDC